MPWLDDDFELNYMGPMGDSDKARGGLYLLEIRIAYM
jgi:hypothetical protein